MKDLVIAFCHKTIDTGASVGTALEKVISPLRPLHAISLKACLVILRPSTVATSAKVIASSFSLVKFKLFKSAL